MAKSPVTILYTTDSVELATKDGVATGVNSRGFITVGVDGGGDAQFILVDTSGRQVVVGAGVAGTPAGGVVSVQGVAGGTDLPISVATLPLPTGAATEATLATRAGEHTTAGSPHAVRLTDGTFFYNATTPSDTQPISAASLPLPTGAATETTLATRLAEATFTARINTLGQKAMVASTPVVVASDQSAIPVSDGGGSLTVDGSVAVTNFPAVQPVSDNGGSLTVDGAVDVTDGGGSLTVDGTVTADQGNAGTHVQRWMVGLSDGSGFISPATDRTLATAPFSVRLSDGTAFYTAPSSGQLPTALVGGRLDTNLGAWLGSTAPTVGQKAMASSVPVVLASDQTALPVSQSGTWTVQQGTPPWSVSQSGSWSVAQSGTWTVEQGTPPWSVVGPGASGAALSGNPVRIAFSDGTNTRDALSDASGRLQVVGAAASGAAAAGNPVLAAGSDGTNARTLRTATDGTVRVDPTGTTTQPVSDAGGSLTVDDGGTSLTVDGTVTANQGNAGSHAQRWMVGLSDGSGFISPATDRTLATAPFSVRLSDGTAFYTAPNSGQLPGALVGGRLDVNVGAWLGSTAPTVGQKAMASSVPVVVASDQAEFPVQQGTAAALSGAWPVKHTDGTNTMPTADAAARAIYARLTDGTNTIGTLFKTLYSDPNGDRRTIHNNATLTSTGNQVLTWVGYAEWYLIVNLKNAPTGTSPTIQFKIEQVDPIDGTTVLTDARSWTGVVHTTNDQEIIEIPELVSDSIKISWTITGASASWTGVNVAFCGHAAGNAIEGQSDVGTVAEDPPVPVAGVDDSDQIQYLRVDGAGNLQVVLSNISADAVPGLSSGIVSLGGGTSNTQQAIRATAYTEQSSNAQRSIASSNANDTSAGTGARQVKITYFTATGTGPFTETVNLNGTAAVATTATDICFIEKLEVVSVGSGGANAGTITLYVNNAGGGGTIGTIGVGNVVTGVGDNQTLWAHHYVPASKTASLATLTVSATSSGSGTNAKFYLKEKAVLTANAPENIFGDVIVIVGAFRRAVEIPQKITGFRRITAYGVPGVNNALLSASFDYSEI